MHGIASWVAGGVGFLRKLEGLQEALLWNGTAAENVIRDLWGTGAEIYYNT
jgi:hypothetical protein